ncbi:MAG: GntR family transcriptional regulator [Phycisphaeraceae bacterium]|nr:GntR family transcriptional regulator [Phycisphaeraceae bacterium]
MSSTSSDLKLRDQAYGYICRQLVDGRIGAGSRLSVGSLAKELGISRTPVSEALRRLQLEHVVEQVPRVGTIVRKPSLLEIRELYDLRILLESYAVMRAARARNPRRLNLLEQLLDQFHGICADLRDSGKPYLTPEQARRFLALDMAFHAVILQSIRTPQMRRMIEDMRVFTLIFATRRHDHQDLPTIARIYLWHTRIYRAIRDGNAPAARRRMRGHLRFSRDGAIKFLRHHATESAPVDLDLASLMPRGVSLTDDAFLPTSGRRINKKSRVADSSTTKGTPQ